MDCQLACIDDCGGILLAKRRRVMVFFTNNLLSNQYIGVLAPSNGARGLVQHDDE